MGLAAVRWLLGIWWRRKKRGREAKVTGGGATLCSQSSGSSGARLCLAAVAAWWSGRKERERKRCGGCCFVGRGWEVLAGGVRCWCSCCDGEEKGETEVSGWSDGWEVMERVTDGLMDRN
ncbi:hypothetical protein HAX54_002971 [Datura stramonium]|uniref:Uncharacterized protein n=1 Tax=Datura stramonium TaxID=4076 RepID=A0ABS8WRR0_DATST|nr:hypothetical protein [Datura stramonium]